MKKATKATKIKSDFDWKGLVRTLHELEVDVTATRLSAFITAKGIAVSPRSVSATRANINRG